MYEEQRFWAKVEKKSDSECWVWLGAIDGKGYGAFWSIKDHKQHIASRYSYLISFGEIPDGKLVCHKCDNPKCVNPKHLFLGTPQENMIDKVRKGRSNAPKGTRQGTSKLTESQVLQIREMAKTKTLAQVAKAFGISFQHVSDLKNFKRWSWLKG